MAGHEHEVYAEEDWMNGDLHGGRDGTKRQEVLERLATFEPWNLCSESKVEKCRAPRDLRSCGRTVQHLLTSCGHACLCLECSQRCDVCPICRTPITRNGPVLRLRLYEECVEANLISVTHNAEFREQEKVGPYWSMDAWRLCSFFDVALENNLVSLVCHYVTDVCMDDRAVSSDPAISVLLDGNVVKEWCRKTFVGVVRNLREIYNSKQLQVKTDILDKIGSKLKGVCYVLDTLEAPLNALSTSLDELQQLLEGVKMVMQHLEMMIWCVHHHFLENVPSVYSNAEHWRIFQERKNCASQRCWPDYVPITGQLGAQPEATLFIEDAMTNIGIGREDFGNVFEMREIEQLRHTNLSATPAKLRRDFSGLVSTNTTRIYPPDNTRAAVDLFFLEGTSDMVLAKKAIFLYYLFDRHWTPSDSSWKNIVEDYINTFCLSRGSLLESFVFYLLDNSSDPALKEASRLLPEIVGPNLHPKIGRVLLERDYADVALSVLQASGRDCCLTNTAVALFEAVTCVRIWVECGLLPQAYMYQKSHCKAVREESAEHESIVASYKGDGDEEPKNRDWLHEMNVLVGELCWLCIQRNYIEKMIELPWTSEEEKVIRRCLMEQSKQDSSSAAGSLLVVFYFQRCRYMEAYRTHRKLCRLEQQFIVSCADEHKISLLQTTMQQRSRIIEKCIQLLPEAEREETANSDSDDAAESLTVVSMDVVEDHHRRRRCRQSTSAAPNPGIFSPVNKGIFPSDLLLSKKKQQQQQQQTTPVDDMRLLSPSVGRSSYRQPSILHGKPPTPSPSSSSFSSSSSSAAAAFLNGTIPTAAATAVTSAAGNGNAAAVAAAVFSPLQSKRLRYEAADIGNGSSSMFNKNKSETATAVNRVVTW